MLTKFTKSVFVFIGILVTALLLYILFFGGGIGGNNAITFLCRSIETPIAESYYEVTLHPSVNSSLSGTQGLGITVDNNTSLDTDEVDDASMLADYSTGWQ